MPDLEEARHRVDPRRHDDRRQRRFRVRADVQDARPDPHDEPDRARAQELSGRPGSEISKPEIEWIATTLRAVLGVPATDAPTGNAIRESLRGQSDLEVNF